MSQRKEIPRNSVYEIMYEMLSDATCKINIPLHCASEIELIGTPIISISCNHADEKPIIYDNRK